MPPPAARRTLLAPARTKEATVTPDERIGKRVATLTAHGRETFPLTGGWIQRQARRLGHPIGMHRALRIRRLLIEQKVIEPVGGYPHRRAGLPTGFKVTLFRLRQRTSSVGRQARQVPWWQHPLFGFASESYPAGLQDRWRKWKPRPWKGESDG